MSYDILWQGKIAHVKYTGSVSNEDIEGAHFKLNGDGRFYDCKGLILDISDCNASPISVPDLTVVIATDLGASATIKTLKVAMVSNELEGQTKVSQYILRNREYNSPWDMKLFENADDAFSWLNS
ncbi:MAG: hypothetical protein KTR16_12160 [Acidiferrobacterales bacterium]|nr:hypothetical protein [Acidiferrobacterales bacterium]